MNLRDIVDPHGMDVLEIYVLISPVLVAALALGVYWLTGWMDRRDGRRHAAE
jgi:hypothetical protein